MGRVRRGTLPLCISGYALVAEGQMTTRRLGDLATWRPGDDSTHAESKRSWHFDPLPAPIRSSSMVSWTAPQQPIASSTARMEDVAATKSKFLTNHQKTIVRLNPFSYFSCVEEVISSRLALADGLFCSRRGPLAVRIGLAFNLKPAAPASPGQPPPPPSDEPPAPSAPISISPISTPSGMSPAPSTPWSSALQPARQGHPARGRRRSFPPEARGRPARLRLQHRRGALRPEPRGPRPGHLRVPRHSLPLPPIR